MYRKNKGFWLHLFFLFSAIFNIYVFDLGYLPEEFNTLFKEKKTYQNCVCLFYLVYILSLPPALQIRVYTISSQVDNFAS